MFLSMEKVQYKKALAYTPRGTIPCGRLFVVRAFFSLREGVV